jgi:ABC-2 type transport system ATP-binding protein
MEEAERLCDRIVLLDTGRIVAAGTASELVGASGIASSLFLRMQRSPPADWLDGLAAVRVLAANGTRTTLAIDDPTAMPVLLARAARAGGEIVELRLDHPTLADTFFALTGRALHGDNGAGNAGSEGPA